MRRLANVRVLAGSELPPDAGQDQQATTEALRALNEPARQAEAVRTFERALRFVERWNERMPLRWDVINLFEKPHMLLLSVEDAFGAGRSTLAEVRSALEAEKIPFGVTVVDQYTDDEFAKADLVWILGDQASPVRGGPDDDSFISNRREAFASESLRCVRCGRTWRPSAQQVAALEIDTRYLTPAGEPPWDLANADHGTLVASMRLVGALEAIGATGFQTREVRCGGATPSSIVQLGATSAGCELDVLRTKVGPNPCTRCLFDAGQDELSIYADSVGGEDVVSIGPHPFTDIYIRGGLFAELRRRGLLGIHPWRIIHLSQR